jgi:4-oxalocrotonate tautomerase
MKDFIWASLSQTVARNTCPDSDQRDALRRRVDATSRGFSPVFERCTTEILARAFCVAALAPGVPAGYLSLFHTEKAMPLIHVELFEGRTPDIKREFVEAITRETCRVLKCEPGAVDIILRDVKKSDWATGGVIWSEKK